MVGISLDLLSTLSSQLNTHSMAAIFKLFNINYEWIYSIHIRASELVWLSRKLTLISHLKWSFSTTKLERERETRSKSSFGWLQRLSYIYDYGSPYILHTTLETQAGAGETKKNNISHEIRFSICLLLVWASRVREWIRFQLVSLFAASLLCFHFIHKKITSSSSWCLMCVVRSLHLAADRWYTHDMGIRKSANLNRKYVCFAQVLWKHFDD